MTSVTDIIIFRPVAASRTAAAAGRPARIRRPVVAPTTPSPADVADLDTVSDEELEQRDIQPLRWIIPGFVPEGLTILVGNPKAGKSALVLGWAYALARGVPVMGRVQVERCETLYLALEDPDRRVRDRLRAIRDGGPTTVDLRFVTMNSKTPFRRLNTGGKQQIERHLDKHPRCRLVIIDTWAKVKPTRAHKHAQEYDLDSAAWSILHTIAVERRVAIVVLHHTRKALNFEGDWTQEVSGTQGIAGTVDTILLFKRPRGEAKATLMVTGRDVDEEKQYALRGDARTLSWTLADLRQEQQQPRGQMLEVLNTLQADGLMRPQDVERACPGISNVRVYLQRLVDQGFAIRHLDGTYTVEPRYRSYGVTACDGVTAVTAGAIPNCRTVTT